MDTTHPHPAGQATPTTTERNADSPSVDCQRNGPLSNAERQRRYRDRRRGGPPVGRWDGHMSVKATLAVFPVGRSFYYMTRWLRKYAPEVIPDLEAGKAKITPTYQRVRHEHELAYFRALIAERDADGDQAGDDRRPGRQGERSRRMMTATVKPNGHAKTPIVDVLAGGQRALLSEPAGDGEPRAAKKVWRDYYTQKRALSYLPTVGLLSWAVYSILCRRANDVGESYPSQERLAEEVGVKSSRAIRNALTRLEGEGLVEVVSRWIDGHKRNTYRIASLGSPDPTGTTVPPPMGGRGTSVPVVEEPTFQTNRNLRSYEGTPEKKEPQRRNPRERAGKAGDLPEALRELITLWNGLGPSIVKPGNGARLDAPSQAVLKGWAQRRRRPSNARPSGICPSCSLQSETRSSATGKGGSPCQSYSAGTKMASS